MVKNLIPAVCALSLILLPEVAAAGGAWMPGKGKGDIQLGFSRKRAHHSWDASGNGFENGGFYRNHDFRYVYLSGEIGFVDRLSMTYLVTWLDGLEGPTDALRRNAGPSDSWFGLKFGLRQGQTPMAVQAEVRTDDFYDIDGPYTRELFDEEGNSLGESPEWRGLLKEDYSLYYLVSHSFGGGQAWANLKTGYTWREGAPADQWPLWIDGGHWLLDGRLTAQGSLVWVRSLGNDSPRQPDDRFGARPTFNFNDASMARIGASVAAHFGKDRSWWAEAGYNKWIWGRSARRYSEPFLSLGHSF
jgi:hypothetical protein